MKILNFRIVILFISLVTLSLSAVSQNEVEVKHELMETKTALLETKLILLEQKVNNMEMETQYVMDDLSGLELYYQHKLDSSLKLLNKKITNFRKEKYPEKTYKSAIQMDPIKVLQGTLQLSYERMINPSSSIDVAILGTYVTENGLGFGYVKNQELSVYDEYYGDYRYINAQMFRGLGGILQYRYYLPAGKWINSNPPLGFYVGPQLMYRKVWIDGEFSDIIYLEDGSTLSPITKISEQLDIVSGGIFIGGKFNLLDVFCVDIYAGGSLRLSKYGGEKELTRYKDWMNIDYTGVVPSAGLRVGILR